jgi:hypothetical protein
VVIPHILSHTRRTNHPIAVDLQVAVVGTGILFLSVKTTATRKQLGRARKKRSLIEVGDEDEEDELMLGQ